MQGQVLQEVCVNTESAKIFLDAWGGLLTTFELLAGAASQLLWRLKLKIFLTLVYKV